MVHDASQTLSELLAQFGPRNGKVYAPKNIADNIVRAAGVLFDILVEAARNARSAVLFRPEKTKDANAIALTAPTLGVDLEQKLLPLAYSLARAKQPRFDRICNAPECGALHSYDSAGRLAITTCGHPMHVACAREYGCSLCASFRRERMKALAKVIKASNDAPLSDEDAFDWDDGEARMDGDDDTSDEPPAAETAQECLVALLQRVEDTALPVV